MVLDEVGTLLDLSRHWAKVCPDDIVYTFLSDGESDEENITYAELDRRARAIASELQNLGAQGQRVLLLYPSGLDFICGFWACIYAGVVGVPAYPPDPKRMDRTLPRLQAVVHSCNASYVLTTTNIKAMAEFVFPSDTPLTQLTWLSSEELQVAGEDKWGDPGITPNSLAFLQYTSGSTGLPKGVMIRHRNIIANERQLQKVSQSDKSFDLFSWLPFYHDMGLIIGILHGPCLGSRSVLMSPFDFLRKPIRWLNGITKYRTSGSGAPNFAYELCVQRIRPKDREHLDLSSWSMAGCGAEPVQAGTLERFVQGFSHVGFKKAAYAVGYGMAESVLSLTMTQVGIEPSILRVEADELSRGHAALSSSSDALHVVSCGPPHDGVEVKIVDPKTLEVCPDQDIGEVWARSDNVADGYWQNEEATAAVFSGALAGEPNRKFLRTGDLGFQYDGEVNVTGRIK